MITQIHWLYISCSWFHPSLPCQKSTLCLCLDSGASQGLVGTNPMNTDALILLQLLSIFNILSIFSLPLNFLIWVWLKVFTFLFCLRVFIMVKPAFITSHASFSFMKISARYFFFLFFDVIFLLHLWNLIYFGNCVCCSLPDFHFFQLCI